jgi:ankyrin repeat protein
VRSSEDGLYQTLLHIAAANGFESIVKIILSKIANNDASAQHLLVDERDAYLRTALHIACASNHAGIAKLLLVAGADPYAEDIQSHTPMQLADGTAKLKTQMAQQSSNNKTGIQDFFASGELAGNEPASSVLKLFADVNTMFWTASQRANKWYNDKMFEKAIQAYTNAIDLALQCTQVR